MSLTFDYIRNTTLAFNQANHTKMLKREFYLKQIRPFMGTDLIKVLTGVRRCGKSVMLELIKAELLERGIAPERFLYLNFEEISGQKWLDGDALHAHVLQLAGEPETVSGTEQIVAPEKRFVLLLDEVQILPKWELYINSLRLHKNIDIYVTGSNSKLLSGELATLLTGRFVSFEIHPFSFREFLALRRSQGSEKTEAEVFSEYIILGGMPFVAQRNLDYSEAMKYLRDIYNTILLKDVVERHALRDVDLLNRVIQYVLANIGKTFSALSVSKYLKNEKIKATPDTILNYLLFCEEAFLFRKVRRNDLNGKRLLSINEKYYVCDHGLREMMFHNNSENMEIVLENIVCAELQRRYWEVYVGKIGGQEIDFVAKKQSVPIYVQVAYYIVEESTKEREFGALEKINDNYPKYVVSMNDFNSQYNGIKHHNVRDFLLSDDF
ncbi:MAG: ATP-binding protein [Puniceicoccales bacterium]|jgi:predicted AAA+ superfamily ATPase|nr:ATP-binding protein [Puniceicoccales bacterium]